jgi:hypothetical protein
MSGAGPSDFACRISAGNMIVEAGNQWIYLLHRDSIEEVVPPPYLGKLLWNHLSDTTTSHLYEALIAKVRRTGRELSVPSRCDLPGRRHHLGMQILPRPAGGIEFRALTLREEPLPAAASPGRRRFSAQMLRICGWCKRIPAPEWLEVDEAIRRLKLLEADEIVRLTHGICPECAQRMIAEAEGRGE